MRPAPNPFQVHRSCRNASATSAHREISHDNTNICPPSEQLLRSTRELHSLLTSTLTCDRPDPHITLHSPTVEARPILSSQQSLTIQQPQWLQGSPRWSAQTSMSSSCKIWLRFMRLEGTYAPCARVLRYTDIATERPLKENQDWEVGASTS